MAVLYDSSGVTISGSTQTLNPGKNALLVREVLTDSTTGSGIAATAGDNTIIAATTQAIYVYAFTVAYLSTIGSNNRCRFLNGSTIQTWETKLGFNRNEPGTTTATPMMSVPVTCVVNPPAYLFRTSTGNALLLNVTSTGVNYAVACWRE